MPPGRTKPPCAVIPGISGEWPTVDSTRAVRLARPQHASYAGNCDSRRIGQEAGSGASVPATPPSVPGSSRTSIQPRYRHARMSAHSAFARVAPATVAHGVDSSPLRLIPASCRTLTASCRLRPVLAAALRILETQRIVSPLTRALRAWPGRRARLRFRP